MKKETLFKTSLLLNLILAIGLGGYAFHQRDKISQKVNALLGTYQSPSETALANFNNVPWEAVNDSLMAGSDTTISILFLGNSLTYHAVIDEEPAEGKRGLTATTVEKDYVHVLLNTIAKQHHLNIHYSILNIAEFERSFTRQSFNMDKLAYATNKQPDLLIVQIGENVANVAMQDIEYSHQFEEEYLKLLANFPHSKRIITLPFWPVKEKEYAITDVATISNSFLVDLSHLGDGTDPENFASSHKKYAMQGVGAHPGDDGMARIADCLYTIVNALLESWKESN